MAIRNLTNWHDPIFRKKSRLVEKFDDRLWNLLDDMLETLKKAGGYGCAAVHVGVLRRVIIVDDDSGVIELINPIITKESTDIQDVQEGSIAPGAPRYIVSRPMNVTVSALDRNGNPINIKASEFLAATLCHEIDHLDGILFSDKRKDLE
jgi:peptide deformylase